MVTLTTSDAVCFRVTMSITLWWCGREIDYAKCLCWFQMVGALADADDLSMSGIVYFLWVFSRNWHMSLSLWHVCVLFSSHCCLFWFLFGNLCIFTGFSHLLRFSFSLLGLWIFLLFSLWCASCFTLLSRVYGLCLRGFWILFYPLLIYVLCQLRVILYCWASYSPWMSSALFLDKTKEEESPGFYMYCWSRIVILNISDFMFSFHLNFVCIVDIENVLRSWISMILCSLFTSISWFFVTQLYEFILNEPVRYEINYSYNRFTVSQTSGSNCNTSLPTCLIIENTQLWPEWWLTNYNTSDMYFIHENLNWHKMRDFLVWISPWSLELFIEIRELKKVNPRNALFPLSFF